MGSGRQRRTWYKQYKRRQRWNAAKPWVLGAGAAAVVLALVAMIGSRDSVEQPVDDYTPPAAFTSKAPRPSVAFVGDSLTAGTELGGLDSDGYPALVGDALDVRSKVFAVGGTGFVNGGTKGGRMFGSRAEDVIEYAPDAVVVVGGGNDRFYSAEEVEAAANDLLKELRAGLPDVELVLVGPLWTTTEGEADAAHLRKPLESAAEAHGAEWVDPAGWFAGHEDLIGPDGIHPTNEGHELLAEKMEAALAGVID